MANYKLSLNAQEDLIRIHQYGIVTYGEEAADKYFWAFFDRFEHIAKSPYSYKIVNHIRPGYRQSICGTDTIYFRIVDNMVEIMAILGKQDTNIWL